MFDLRFCVQKNKVEALAQRIVSGQASGWLAGKKLRSLDVALLTAGTRLRGDFEERLRFLLEDADREGAGRVDRTVDH